MSHFATLNATLGTQLGSALEGIVAGASQVLESRVKLLNERHRQTQGQIDGALREQRGIEDLASRLNRELETLEDVTGSLPAPCL
ncbi:MAG: hypothetical protein R3F31_03410 [Verrucomicrobiales bacterium]